MKKTSVAVLTIVLFTCFNAFAQQSPFEKSKGKASATYDEIINWYQSLAKRYTGINILNKGKTDAGLPLNVVLISSDGSFDPVEWHRKNKIVFLINNGIHAGEPDGIDASMMLVRDLLEKKSLPQNVALAIIPVYNIGGVLNRSSTSRANQNGPLEYGFRGNSQNLDLNRDFIKCDSKEAIAFSQLFHFLNPDIFLDNHVSDGADYQHTMTLLTTQYNKLGKEQGDWLRDVFEPKIYQTMSKKGWDLVPYVDFEFTDLNKGMTMFNEPPRFGSGYAALFQTFSFVAETHMLKPFADRVKSTYDLMKSMIDEASNNSSEIIAVRKAAQSSCINETYFPLKWVPDYSQFNNITFKGYEKDSGISEATGLNKYFFNHQKPFEKKIKFFCYYKGEDSIVAPSAYVIPQGWEEVINRLKANNVKITTLKKDTLINVNAYYITSNQSLPNAYEKHHKNFATKTELRQMTIPFRKGDYLITTNQSAKRYLVESLEPRSEDGFFSWNFFDAILQQKEGYSDYRWEQIAAEILKNDAALRKELDLKKQNDPEFAADSHKILDYIYKHSPYYEKTHLRYPVYRIEK